MVYQLASICEVAPYSLGRFIADVAACKERLAELGLKPFGRGWASPPLLTEVGGGRRVGTSDIPGKFTGDD